jgi:hypothetical protein
MTINTIHRNFDLKATVKIKKPMSCSFASPNEDIVNWWHLELSNKHTVFYKILDSEKAKYDKEMDVKLSFLDNNIIKEILPNKLYNLYRGPEKIGQLIIK